MFSLINSTEARRFWFDDIVEADDDGIELADEAELADVKVFVENEDSFCI